MKHTREEQLKLRNEKNSDVSVYADNTVVKKMRFTQYFKLNRLVSNFAIFSVWIFACVKVYMCARHTRARVHTHESY